MKSLGSTKLLLIGLGAILAYSHFGPMGLIALGVIAMLMT